jgi:CheY-like chemotaxis protein
MSGKNRLCLAVVFPTLRDRDNAMRIVLVDDDVVAMQSLRELLHRLGAPVVLAATADEGIRLATDGNGTIVLVTHGVTPTERPPMTVPAEPANAAAAGRSETHHAAARWARIVVGAIDSDADPRTQQLWGRCVGVSSGTLRTWCRTARLSTKRTLKFARVLRAIVRRRESRMAAEQLLDVSDHRTLASLLSLGRPIERATDLPANAELFLYQQRWIDDPIAIVEVRALLKARGFETA